MTTDDDFHALLKVSLLVMRAGPRWGCSAC